MKTAEELNNIKTELEDLKEKLATLTEEELNQVAGGIVKVEYIAATKSKKDFWLFDTQNFIPQGQVPKQLIPTKVVKESVPVA